MDISVAGRNFLSMATNTNAQTWMFQEILQMSIENIK